MILRHELILSLAAGLILGCSNSSSDQHQAPAAPPPAGVTPAGASGAPETPARKLALLVGINRYRDGNIRALNGALNDLRSMKLLLTGKYDFAEGDIRELPNEQATRDGILAAFREHLIGQAGPGDIVVFYYSGHGSQVLDEADGDEDDGLDETLVPYDSSNSGDRDITDDEINELIHALSQKTGNITFIIDSCASGTLSRGAGAARFVSRDLQPAAAPAGRGTTSADQSDFKNDNVSYTLLAAARANQLAREFEAPDGSTHGAFTYYLAETLGRADAGATYRDAYDVVKGKVSALHPTQQPTLEGTAADTLIFGDTRVNQQMFLPVSPAPGAGDVFIDAGQAQGLTEGSVFRIYPPGTRSTGQTGLVMATAEVTRLWADRARARLDREVDIPPGSRAAEWKHHYGDSRLRVRCLDPAPSSPLGNICGQLAQFEFMEIAGPGERYHLLVEQSDEHLLVEAADSGLVKQLDVTRSGLVAEVVGLMGNWAKWHRVLSMENPNPDPRMRIGLSVEAKTTRGATRSPFKFVGDPDAEFEEGEEILLTIESKSRKDLHFNVLDLSTDGSIVVVHPEHGRSEMLPKGQSTTVRMKTFVPEDYGSVTDVLKVIASTEPLDFSFLTQQPLVRGETRSVGADNPVEKLLSDAALGTRSLREPVPLDEWVTAQRVLRIVKRGQ